MKTLTTYEFEEYCNTRKPKCFTYSTSNQPDSKMDCAQFSLRFSKVITILQPNQICFVSDDNSVRIGPVLRVQIDDEQEGIGTIIRIICGNKRFTRSYTWLMD